MEIFCIEISNGIYVRETQRFAKIIDVLVFFLAIRLCVKCVSKGQNQSQKNHKEETHVIKNLTNHS